jgi:hypothetical protein
MIFGSVRREIFIAFDSVWSSEYLPHPPYKKYVMDGINLCKLFLISVFVVYLECQKYLALQWGGQSKL